MTRKFITDLFTSNEHYSFSSIDEAVEAIFASSGLINTVHECEAPSICNDVTEAVAWAFAEALDHSEPLSDWQRDYIEQNLGIMAARAFPRAA
ncbi:TPA: hypothetical protein O5T86_001282 [Staphylococcus aureus]|nr:hypothetical protein [Staphylococcus aureus]HDA7217737.1 hypothetical protein [Staphylococcus aureus]HDA7235031.1 hypothetical protein [Staphylococcus aureus]HDA7236819.1 hypothetical protein [Staphylococcus aureus]HDA7239245.1 hypothetical protein [Staphylococcus aureus]